MSTPGAVTDGTIVSTARLGPRDEKLAMMSPSGVVDDERGAGDRGPCGRCPSASHALSACAVGEADGHAGHGVRVADAASRR